MLDSTAQNLRYAARALLRSPLFTIIAALSIAIGVGATTAIVTLANTLLLRSAPGIGHPDRVVSLGRTQDGQGFDNFSYPNFVDYREAKSLSGISGLRIDPERVSLGGPSGGEPIYASFVSGNFFTVLETRPLLGRFFRPDEDRIGGENAVVVLTHKFWRDRFSSDPSIVGRAISLNGLPFTVVGVAAERFQGPYVLTPDVWVPLTATPLLGRLPAELFTRRNAVWIMAIGRLAPSATLSSAQAELGAIAARQALKFPDANRGKGLKVVPATFFPGDAGNPVTQFMAMLFAVAMLVLVIASTNVAGMLLARATARQREIAVRLAIGGTRAQLIRQLVTESVLLFFYAGILGIFLAKVLVAGLMAMIPRLPVQLSFDPSIDWRVLGFALGVSLVTGLAAGLVPAIQTTYPDLVPSLKSDSGVTSGPRRQRLRGTLLVAQIAFSMLLLIVAGLFTRTLLRARSIDAGFDGRGVSITSLDFGLARYDSARGVALAATLLERTRALPGVQSAALSRMLPLDGSGLGLGSIDVEGRTSEQREAWREDWNIATPQYFETLSIPIVSGRAFTDADRAGAPYVAILNETFAATIWPGEDPIGKTFRNGRRGTVTIVGVARNAKYRSLGERTRNFIYVPHAQFYDGRMNLLVKTNGAAPLLAIRRLVSDIDRNLPVLDQRTMEEQTATSLFPQRVALWVAASLGGVALLLALLGIYGVTAYSVTQRTREIGVRVALGAQRGHVLGLVLKQGAVLAGVGVVVGALLAFGITRLLSSLLYGVPPTDAVAFVGAAALLALAALAASWMPARRAAAVDPVVALRSE